MSNAFATQLAKAVGSSKNLRLDQVAALADRVKDIGVTGILNAADTRAFFASDAGKVLVNKAVQAISLDKHLNEQQAIVYAAQRLQRQMAIDYYRTLSDKKNNITQPSESKKEEKTTKNETNSHLQAAEDERNKAQRAYDEAVKDLIGSYQALEEVDKKIDEVDKKDNELQAKINTYQSAIDIIEQQNKVIEDAIKDIRDTRTPLDAVDTIIKKLRNIKNTLLTTVTEQGVKPEASSQLINVNLQIKASEEKLLALQDKAILHTIQTSGQTSQQVVQEEIAKLNEEKKNNQEESADETIDIKIRALEARNAQLIEIYSNYTGYYDKNLHNEYYQRAIDQCNSPSEQGGYEPAPSNQYDDTPPPSIDDVIRNASPAQLRHLKSLCEQSLGVNTSTRKGLLGQRVTALKAVETNTARCDKCKETLSQKQSAVNTLKEEQRASTSSAATTPKPKPGSSDNAMKAAKEAAEKAKAAAEAARKAAAAAEAAKTAPEDTNPKPPQ